MTAVTIPGLVAFAAVGTLLFVAFAAPILFVGLRRQMSVPTSEATSFPVGSVGILTVGAFAALFAMAALHPNQDKGSRGATIVPLPTGHGLSHEDLVKPKTDSRTPAVWEELLLSQLRQHQQEREERQRTLTRLLNEGKAARALAMLRDRSAHLSTDAAKHLLDDLTAAELKTKRPPRLLLTLHRRVFTFAEGQSLPSNVVRQFLRARTDEMDAPLARSQPLRDKWAVEHGFASYADYERASEAVLKALGVDADAVSVAKVSELRLAIALLKEEQAKCRVAPNGKDCTETEQLERWRRIDELDGLLRFESPTITSLPR